MLNMLLFSLQQSAHMPKYALKIEGNLKNNKNSIL